MIHCLYKSTCLVTHKFYIGVHTTIDIGFGTDSWKDSYIGSGKSILRALKKYGRESFNVEVVAYFDHEDYAYEAESYIVTEEWLTFMKNKVYNMVIGGSKPPKTTKKSAIKSYQTAILRGTKINPPKHKDKIWITNGIKDRRVSSFDNIEIGWKIGRSFDVSEKTKEAFKKQHEKQKLYGPWNKGKKDSMITKEKKRKASINRIPPLQKGKIWVNNGKENKRVYLDQIPEGYNYKGIL